MSQEQSHDSQSRRMASRSNGIAQLVVIIPRKNARRTTVSSYSYSSLPLEDLNVMTKRAMRQICHACQLAVSYASMRLYDEYNPASYFLYLRPEPSGGSIK